MGVTVNSKNYSIDLGYIGFNNLRTKVAEISVEDCKAIWEVIKDYDTNVLYGYVGRPDCAKFKDFKNIVKDCIDNNCNMEWF